MTNSLLLNSYIPLVEFLGKALGQNTEIVLNDLSHPASSVIAIANGFHSGRTIGAPLTDFALKVMNSSDEYDDKSYVIHYKATANGNTFLSSTFFIKNHENKIIGMLCLNTNTIEAKYFLLALKKLFKGLNMSALIEGTEQHAQADENLNTPINSLVNNLISKTLKKYISPNRMTKEEKIAIVAELVNKGVTSTKGSIAEIAKQLEVSESTVYRYINSSK